MVGEISVAESNHNSDVKERIKNKAKRRNSKCPREGSHQAVVPRWMDRPWLKRCMAEHFCTLSEAVARARERESADLS